MAVFEPSPLFARPFDASALHALHALDQGVRARTLERWLGATLGRALGVPPAHRIRMDRPLRTLGVDPLLALHLKRQLEAALQIPIVAHDLLREATPAQLSALLAREVASPQAAGPAGR